MSMIGQFLALPQSELDALRRAPQDLENVMFDAHGDSVVDVDKAWHGIHFLLNGTVGGGTAPLAHVLYGRTPLDEDMTYGPVMATDAADVPAIAAALAAVPDETLRERFKPEAMDDIYPHSWEEADALDWLIDHLQALRAFYREAAAANQAVLIWLG